MELVFQIETGGPCGYEVVGVGVGRGVEHVEGGEGGDVLRSRCGS